MTLGFPQRDHNIEGLRVGFVTSILKEEYRLVVRFE